MLYVPYDIQNRILRTKGFRVLCLCHLGLSQLDRAQEYINEAEKVCTNFKFSTNFRRSRFCVTSQYPDIHLILQLQPDIASAFLKVCDLTPKSAADLLGFSRYVNFSHTICMFIIFQFKIYLQRNDHTNAIAQVQAMSSCLDFTPDFLSLSAHEAVACHSLPVAIASLSLLLNFYSSGKPMPAMEVVVFRTLVTILTQDTGHASDILKYIKRAHDRVSEVGAERFFGKGEVGKRERNWFAVNAWNFGVQMGKEKCYGLSAQFFRLASEFYSIIFDGEAEDYSVMVSKSLVLCVSAIIADEKQTNSTLLESEAIQAIELSDRAGKVTKQKTDYHHSLLQFLYNH